MIMAGRGKRFENASNPLKKVGEGNTETSEESSVDLPFITKMINDINLTNIDDSHLNNIRCLLKKYLKSKNVLKDSLSEFHSKALSDSEFGEKLIIVLEELSNLDVEGTLVRDELLSHVQNDFLMKESISESDRTKFINAVNLLGNIFNRIKVCGVPIIVLGVALLEYFNLLIKGDEEEIKILTRQILISGAKLPESNKEELLVQELRSTLITRNLSTSAKYWILLAIDFISNDYKPLKGLVRDFYMKNLGEEYTKLEPLVACVESAQNKESIQSPSSPTGSKSPASTSPKNKSTSSPSEISRIKKDMTKISNMTVKESNGSKDKGQSPSKKNNKTAGWKPGKGGRGSSGHDDRFEKEENFYGVQKPRQPKPEGQKKKCQDHEDNKNVLDIPKTGCDKKLEILPLSDNESKD